MSSEVSHDEDDALGRDDAKSSMMPRTFETVATGSLFSWRVVATCRSDLDVDTFHTMTSAFLSNARVGGKRGTGHGLLRAIAGRGIAVNRPADATHAIEATSLSPKLGELFRAHVRARASKIAPFLSDVNA
ncbi:MAG: hypothetical protein ACRDQZ_09950 [Mycobacteriales bacterium]